jgi:serine/threonine-protein kinase
VTVSPDAAPLVTGPSAGGSEQPAAAAELFHTDVRLRKETEPTQLSVQPDSASAPIAAASSLADPDDATPLAPSVAAYLAGAETAAATMMDPASSGPAVTGTGDALGSTGADRYIGATIDGRYLVEAVLGEGGMGFVYRCRHKVIDKLVAIKILRQEIARDPEVMTRFVNEARAASAIGNPHIVHTVDFGQLPDGSTYFAMEYLEGRTLTDVLTAEPQLALDRMLEFGRQIAEALGAAHEAGIVHRDLKPDNVFIVRRGRAATEFVKILDFGIAKVATAQNKLTRAGTVFGTPHYMSPEQARGAPVDPRTDIYALGVMLYEMASGQVPFDAEAPMSILSQHIHEAPRPPSAVRALPQAVPAALEAVILKCLSKEPSARYQSMAELADDLDKVARGVAPSASLESFAQEANDGAYPAGVPQKLVLSRRQWTLAGAAALGVVVLVAGLLSWDPQVHGRLPTVLRRTAPSGTEVILHVLASSSDEGARPAPVKDGYHEVALIMLPIDAEAFVEERSLGPMPVVVRVKHGETLSVLVRRDHYWPRRISIDGTQARVVVRLQQVTGAKADAALAGSAAPGASAPGAKMPDAAGAADGGQPTPRTPATKLDVKPDDMLPELEHENPAGSDVPSEAPRPDDGVPSDPRPSSREPAASDVKPTHQPPQPIVPELPEQP